MQSSICCHEPFLISCHSLKIWYSNRSRHHRSNDIRDRRRLALLAVLVSGTARSCSVRSALPNGCTTIAGITTCVCDTELCNNGGDQTTPGNNGGGDSSGGNNGGDKSSGVMTSSLGHVIAAVAVLACVITAGYLQLWTSLTHLDAPPPAADAADHHLSTRWHILSGLITALCSWSDLAVVFV